MVQQRRDTPTDDQPQENPNEELMDVDAPAGGAAAGQQQPQQPRTPQRAVSAQREMGTPTLRTPRTPQAVVAGAGTPRGQQATRSSIRLWEFDEEQEEDLDFANVAPRQVNLPESLPRVGGDNGSTFLEAVQQRITRRPDPPAGSQTPGRHVLLQERSASQIAEANAALERELLRTPIMASRSGVSLPPPSVGRTPGMQSGGSQTPSVTGSRTPHRLLQTHRQPAVRPGFAPLPLIERLQMDYNIDENDELLSVNGDAATAGGREGDGGRPRHPISPARSTRSNPANNPQLATTSDISDTARETLVWGTSVDLQDLRRRFLTFLRTYVVQPTTTDDDKAGSDAAVAAVVYTDNFLGIKITADEPCYVQKARHMIQRGLNCMEIDCAHLNSGLYEKVTLWPQEVVPTLDLAACALIQEIATREKLPLLNDEIHVRLWNLPDKLHMRQLSPVDIDRLVSVTGMVIRTSNLIPLMHQAVFFCQECGERHYEEIYDGHINEPERCGRCNKMRSLTIDHNLCHFTDSQIIKLQERPDDVPPGQAPQTLVVIAHQDLVDTINAGDRVTVTGIYRATGMRSNPRQRSVNAVYRTHIDAMHFQRDHLNQLHNDYDNTNTTNAHLHKQQKAAAAAAESGNDSAIADDAAGGNYLIEDEEEREAQLLDPARVDEIRELAAKHDIYERLADAIAPSIYEHMDIKKAILLQILGGSPKENIKHQYGQSFRSNINILLCGDPGTSKSQLLQYVHKLVPRSQYTSGKGSSAVGLTAYITKDPETRQLALQTGALVLSDNGICCIDEFDKMSDSTRSILHEVMEQQTLSIAKAGIICQLNARTSILAAANPVESRWNPNRSIIENLQLPHTLLSRFDLIFLLLDTEDEVYDRRLAHHLISLYQTGRSDAADAAAGKQQNMELDLLRDYLLFARKRVRPAVTVDAKRELIDCYVRMRQLGKSIGVPSAFPRQLESLIRMAEAHAKVRLRSQVDVEDVREAHRLYREALKQAATDPATGRVDVSILTTGMSNAARRQQEELSKRIVEYAKQNYAAHQSVPFHRVFEEFVASTNGAYVRRDAFEEAVRKLQDDGYADLKAKNIVFTARIAV